MTSASGDLQAVRSSATPVRVGPYRALVLMLFAGLTITLILLVASEGIPPFDLLVVFMLLVILAENRDRLFGDETSISGSIVVAVASVVAFRESAPLLGPLACAACAGIYWPHLRERSLDKIVVNASSIGFSALAAAGVVEIFAVSQRTSLLDLLVFTIPAVGAYWLVNTCVLALALSFLRGSEFGRSALLLVRSETSMLGFALLGGLSGLLLLQRGLLLGAAVVTLLLLLVDFLVISPRHGAAARMRKAIASRAYVRIGPLSFAALLAAFGAERINASIGSLVAVVGALVITFLVALLGVHRRLGIWDLHLALGVAIVDTPLVVVFAAAGALAVAVDLWVALLAVSAALVAEFLVAQLRRRRLARRALDDLRLASAVELAVLDTRDRFASSR